MIVMSKLPFRDDNELNAGKSPMRKIVQPQVSKIDKPSLSQRNITLIFIIIGYKI